MTLARDPDPETDPSSPHPVFVSVVIPCLDEAEGISQCVRDAQEAFARNGLEGEVIVVDNGSTDGSAVLASEAGGRVVSETRRGYGSALRAGFAAATGGYIIMADADGSYDFAEIGRFVDQLDLGADIVVGDRMGDIEQGAMPWVHRYIGNPILSGLLNVLFRTQIHDAHCGMRAFRRDVLPRLELQADGMELASEMVIRASKSGLVMRELPITYRCRVGRSKLSRFRDGWRHLRLLLVHAPLYLFVLPGGALGALGVAMMLTVLSRIELLGREWRIHTMVAGSLLSIAGTQVLSLGVCAHAFGTYFMDERSPWLDRARRRLRLEHGLLLGAALILAGLVLGGTVVVLWAQRGFASLSEERLAVLASTLVVVGLQVVFSAFLLSILGLPRRR
jgi:glycosyltransferase involved in cell wall biosynthesis